MQLGLSFLTCRIVNMMVSAFKPVLLHSFSLMHDRFSLMHGSEPHPMPNPPSHQETAHTLSLHVCSRICNMGFGHLGSWPLQHCMYCLHSCKASHSRRCCQAEAPNCAKAKKTCQCALGCMYIVHMHDGIRVALLT